MDGLEKSTLNPKAEKLHQRIQPYIHFCYNCQARDSGEWIWVQGERYDLEDLLDDFKVEEKFRDDICDHLSCLNCGTPLSRGDEIGLESRHDIEVKKHLKKAEKKYSKKIEMLSSQIRHYPTLALSLPLGKSIYNEIQNSSLPECSIEGKFIRSRNLEGSKIFSSDDFLSPPVGVSTEGRFNHAGQSHFYLSNDKETSIIESLQSDKSSLIWLQRLELTKIDKILDLSYNWNELGPSTSTLLVALHQSSALKKSESNEKNWKPDYYLTRFIMDCAKRNGYAGIKYSSTKSDYGINVVLFECTKDLIITTDKPQIILYEPMEEIAFSDPF